MKSNRICIYHANCLDGLAAAWCMYLVYPETQFFALSHGDAPPDCSAQTVYILDFSFSEKIMREVCKVAREVFLLDHHKTAEKLCNLRGVHNLRTVFDLERSGAQIAWDYFHPGKERPPIIEHIGDYDLWKFELGATKEVFAFLCSVNQTFEQLSAINESLINNPIEVATIGSHLLRQHAMVVRDLVKNASHFINLNGFAVPAVNCSSQFASEVGERLLGKFKDAPFSVIYQIRGDYVKFSLRSTNAREDVAEIAKLYGGGGHRNAAAFTMKIDSFYKKLFQ